MAGTKKTIVGLAEELIGVANGSGAAQLDANPGTTGGIKEAVAAQVGELLGVNGDLSDTTGPSESTPIEDVQSASENLDSNMDNLASHLIRESETAVGHTADLVGRDMDTAADGISGQDEFSSKWDWRREATEQAGG